MSHAIDSHYSVYTRATVTARKAHECCACEVPIAPGHRYVRVFVLFEGAAETFKRCLRCEAIFNALVDVLRDRDEWPDEDLACGHTWEENDNGPLPDDIAQLAFLSADEIQRLPRARWMDLSAARDSGRKDGGK